MAVVIGDIHGDVAMARAFLSYKPQETHITLGDIVDSRHKIGLEAEAACLDLLLASDTTKLIWGNHDLAYLPERPWQCYGKFGEMAFRERYQSARHRFLAAIAIDDWLCTHAGVGVKLAKLIPTSILSGGVAEVAAWLNTAFVRGLALPSAEITKGELRYGSGPLFQIPVCRGGVNEYGGLFWFDADGEQSQPAPTVGRQIFGHSPIALPKRGESWVLNGADIVKGTDWINLNAVDGGVWVYDTHADKILNLTDAT